MSSFFYQFTFFYQPCVSSWPEMDPIFTRRTVDDTYDATYKLTGETIHDPMFGNKTISYTYDAVGNRLTKTENGVTTAYAYDHNDRLLSEISNGMTTSYAYDNNGNTISKAGPTESVSYGYDYNNRLIQVDDGSTIVEYQYDTDGMRVQKKSGNAVTHFLLDKNRDYAQVLRETNGSGQTIVDYTYGDDLISQKRGSLKSFFMYSRIAENSGEDLKKVWP